LVNEHFAHVQIYEDCANSTSFRMRSATKMAENVTPQLAVSKEYLTDRPIIINI